MIIESDANINADGEPVWEHPVQSDDYHDYVFHNGKLVGDFEGMYRNSAEVPWDQARLAGEWHTDLGLHLLQAAGPYGSVLEAGCGLSFIASRLTSLGGTVDAFDVSPTAIGRASALHPEGRFFVADLASEDYEPDRDYDLVVVKDVFWYVLDHLETVRQNTVRSMGPGGYLCVMQWFPNLATDYVGKEVFPDPAALQAYLEEDYEPVASVVLQLFGSEEDGPILYFLGCVRGSE